MTYSKIIDCGIIEFLFPAKQTDSRVLGKFPVVTEYLLGTAVVLHNNDLIILIGSFFKNRFHTGLKGLFFFPVGDDNRHQRFSLHRIFHTVKSEIRGMLHSSRGSGTCKVSLNGTLSCFESIHFTCRIICCG